MQSRYWIQKIETLTKNCIDKYNEQTSQFGIYEFGEDKRNKCENIIITELYIFFIYWIDVTLYTFNLIDRERVMNEICDYFFRDWDSDDLLISRMDFYCNNTQNEKCDIPHFWLPHGFDDSQLNCINQSAVLLIDLILQDTILEKHVSDEELYTIHKASLGLFSLSMSELFDRAMSNLYTLLRDENFNAKEQPEKETATITMHVLSPLHGYSKEMIQRNDNNSALIDKWLDASTGCLYMLVMYKEGKANDFFVTKELFETMKKHFDMID